MPSRSCKLVMDKWNRSLNPIYSTQPFTTFENERLLQVVNDRQQKWKEIAKEFPLRNPRSLVSKYSDLMKERTSEGI